MEENKDMVSCPNCRSPKIKGTSSPHFHCESWLDRNGKLVRSVPCDIIAERNKWKDAYLELCEAVWDGPLCPDDGLMKDHSNTIARARKLVTDPNERWVDERSIGAEHMAKLVLEGKDGSNMSDGVCRDALMAAKKNRGRMEQFEFLILCLAAEIKQSRKERNSQNESGCEKAKGDGSH